jgi:hypothetical protein
VVWAEELNSWLKETLANFLLNNGDIGEVIDGANGKITELNEKYGLG